MRTTVSALLLSLLLSSTAAAAGIRKPVIVPDSNEPRGTARFEIEGTVVGVLVLEPVEVTVLAGGAVHQVRCAPELAEACAQAEIGESFRAIGSLVDDKIYLAACVGDDCKLP